MRPIGIDLFAGAGGLSLGFEQAGFDIAAAIDIDPVHCAVHEFNFPKTAVLACSVEELSGNEIREAAAIGCRPIDCVFGGAPCQGFSLIGHRVLDDPRNGLLRDYVRIVTELEAKTFVFENVKGLTVGNHKALLEALIVAFDEAGYAVRTPWKVLNAGHFGTPQSRERLILMGARKGELLPSYPEPTTDVAGRNKRLWRLPDGPTCADAIGDLPDAERFLELLCTDAVKTTAFGKPSAYAAEMRCIANDAWHFGYVRGWDPSILTSSARTEHTEISRRRFAQTAPGTVEPVSRFFKLPEHGVSNTLRAGTDGARGAFTSPRPIHYKYAPLHNCARDGAVSRFPRLVPSKRHQVAWSAADWKRRAATARQGDRRSRNGCIGRGSVQAGWSSHTRRSESSDAQSFECGGAFRGGSPAQQARPKERGEEAQAD